MPTTVRFNGNSILLLHEKDLVFVVSLCLCDGPTCPRCPPETDSRSRKQTLCSCIYIILCRETYLKEKVISQNRNNQISPLGPVDKLRWRQQLGGWLSETTGKQRVSALAAISSLMVKTELSGKIISTQPHLWT